MANVFRVLYCEMFRMARRRPPVVAFLLLVGFIIQGLISYRRGGFWFFYQDSYSAYLAFLSAIGSGISAYWVGVLPLVACLVAGDSLAWDRRTGFIRFFLTRSSRRVYIIGKIVSVTILTGVVVLCGLLLSFGIASVWFPLKLPPWHMVDETATFTNPAAPPSYIFPFPTFFHNLLFTHPFIYVLLVSGIVTLSAVAWALVSLFFSLWTTNIYLVLGGPWLLYMGTTFVMCILAFIVPYDLVQYTPLVLSGGFINSSLTPST